MFIRAERTGKFELPISPSEQMLLYLAAAGHDKYTVATQKYLQNIKNLCSWLEKKYEEGSFTICRNDKLFRDHVTEQTLIRSEQHRDAHARRKKEKLSPPLQLYRFLRHSQSLESSGERTPQYCRRCYCKR